MALLRVGFLILALFGFYASAQLKNYKCDFETGRICSFLSNGRDNKENWKIGRGKSNKADTGPSIDHTLGNANGSYLFVNVSAAGKSSVSLQTVVLKDIYCVRFFYHMYGADIGDLTVSAKSVSNQYDVKNYFTRSRTQGDRWKEALFSVSLTQSMKLRGYNIIFLANHKRNSKTRGDIALDDLEITAGKCPEKKKDATSLCSFDDYDCGYKATRLSSTQWEWKAQGRDITHFDKIPQNDHTLGTDTGGFWLNGIDSSSFSWSATEQTVILNSPEYKKPKDPLNCLHFYYYMDGDGYSWLWGAVEEAYIQVHLNFPSSKSSRQWLTTKAKNTTNHRVWTYVETRVNVSEAFQFQFTSVLKGRVEAVIALDDIKLSTGNCPEAGSCDFEEDKCTWADGDGQYNWVRKSGSSKTNDEIGPSTDKTKENSNGNYVVFSATNKEVGSVANLQSEFFPPGDDALCLSFYYQMTGVDLGTLKVLRREENVTESTLWLLRDDQGSIWKQGMVELKPSILHNQVVFRGITGKGRNGYIALDDIRVRKGEKCDLSPAAADPRYEECDCGTNGTCSFVDGEKICKCDLTFEEDGGTCKQCDCGDNGTCSFDPDGTKICFCNGGYILNKDGKCQKIHTCDLHKPCENGATCLERGKGYLCICEGGLTGKNCTESKWCIENRNTCGRVPCMYDSERNISFCSCSNSFLFNVKSKRCEPCYCGDHGTCLSEGGMKTCECEDKYFERDGICYDPCNPNPCWNFGKCIAEMGGNYTCICKQPFTGKICEEQIQPSSPSVTQSTSPGTRPSCSCGAKSSGCEYDYLGRKRCFCFPGYVQIGDVCSEIQPSSPSFTESTSPVTRPNCYCGKNSVSCNFDRNGNKRCSCKLGYAQRNRACSETCIVDGDCMNGGICRKEADSFFCACRLHFTGDKCETNNVCEAIKARCDAMRAVCRTVGDTGLCECPPDKTYKWISGVCEDICDSKKCLNGRCEIIGKSYKCVCNNGFTGLHCDDKIGRRPDFSIFFIGFITLCIAVLLLSFGTFCLACRLRKFKKMIMKWKE